MLYKDPQVCRQIQHLAMEYLLLDSLTNCALGRESIFYWPHKFCGERWMTDDPEGDLNYAGVSGCFLILINIGIHPLIYLGYAQKWRCEHVLWILRVHRLLEPFRLAWGHRPFQPYPRPEVSDCCSPIPPLVHAHALLLPGAPIASPYFYSEFSALTVTGSTHLNRCNRLHFCCIHPTLTLCWPVLDGLARYCPIPLKMSYQGVFSHHCLRVSLPTGVFLLFWGSSMVFALFFFALLLLCKVSL